MKKSFLLIFLVSISNIAWSGELIPELLALRPNAKIERSVIENYDTRDIARSLVQRLKLLQERAPEGFDYGVDFQRDSRIVMAFKYEYFDSIKEKGFLNQFQLNHSANMDRKRRGIVEDRMMGVKLQKFNRDLNNKAHFLRPKYAYAFVDVPHQGRDKIDPFVSNYGNVLAQFKDEVKERSTLTAGDSLVVIGTQIGKAVTFDATRVSPEKPYQYWEAQIWGELTLNDVEYIMVNCSIRDPRIPEYVRPEQIENMKNAGLEVYQCDPLKDKPTDFIKRYGYGKGERL